MQKTRKLGRNKYWILLVLALVLLYVVIYLVPTVSGALKSTYTVTYGELQIDDESTVYLVRDEQVYLANTSGAVKSYIDEGQMVKKGTTILNMEGSSSGDKQVVHSKFQPLLDSLGADAIADTNGYKCLKSGVASYYADGYEDYFSFKNLMKITEEKARSVEESAVIDLKRDSASRGEPLFKIVSNAKWYMICWLNKDEIEKYAEGEKVDVIFEDDDILASIYKVKKQGDRYLLVLKTNRYYENYDKVRTAQVNIVSSKTSGLVLQTDSIKEEKGVKGVYVKDKFGDFNFTPISILDTDGDVTIVEKSYYYDKDGQYVETVSTYDQVLK